MDSVFKNKSRNYSISYSNTWVVKERKARQREAWFKLRFSIPNSWKGYMFLSEATDDLHCTTPRQNQFLFSIKLNLSSTRCLASHALSLHTLGLCDARLAQPPFTPLAPLLRTPVPGPSPPTQGLFPGSASGLILHSLTHPVPWLEAPPVDDSVS